MTRRVIIDPVTRIEGHAKISIYLDDHGQVHDAHFHVGEFRGFEKFCEGRPMWEMAGITARVCGICPVSHLLASAKAGDAILAVTIPPSAEKLRRFMNLAQIVQSHALSFFHMSAPDLLLGFDAPPEQRNLFGLIAAEPDLARGGIRLRQFGQEIIEALGGKKVHPSWAIPGGVRSALPREAGDRIRAKLDDAFAVAADALVRFKTILDRYPTEAAAFGHFDSLFLGLVAPDGGWEHYGGRLRLMDARGAIIADQLDPARFEDYLGEAVQSDSYLKSPFYKPLGPDAGMYRVGPLARINICERFGTDRADGELAELRRRFGRPILGSFFYHYARLIEIVAALETIQRMLDDPDIYDGRLHADARINNSEGVGCSEAPRGTLFHHYHVDQFGVLQRINLLIATGQNNLAMNRTVAQIAKTYISGTTIPESVLNRVEAGIRAYDPCLSCSTHALGQMDLCLQLFDAQGRMVDEIRR
jgi:NAD-reducing hydrogenase large subunit